MTSFLRAASTPKPFLFLRSWLFSPLALVVGVCGWLLTTSATAQTPGFLWKKPHQTGLYPTDVAAMPDGGVVTSLGTRLDAKGNLVWQKSFKGHAISAKSDGSFVLLGSLEGTTQEGITKYDIQGNLLWRTPLTGGVDELRAVTTTTDGSYVVVSRTTSSDVWVAVKLNDAGNILWKKEIDSFYPIEPTAVTPTPDGGVVVACTIWKFDDDQDWGVFKLDSKGEVVDSRTVGESSIDIPYSAVTTLDGRVLVSGITTTVDGYKRNSYLTVEEFIFGSQGTQPGTANGRAGSTQTQTSEFKTLINSPASNDYLMQVMRDGSLITSKKDKDDSNRYTVTKSRQDETWSVSLPYSESVFCLTGTTDGGVVIVTREYIGKLTSTATPPFSDYLWRKPRQQGSNASISAMPDGGVVTAQGTRFDARGNVVWQKSFTGTGSKISAKSDGNFVILGQLPGGEWGLTEYNIQGNLLWRKAVPEASSGLLTTTTDGGCVVAANFSDAWTVLKFDNKGNLLWRTDIPPTVGGLGIGTLTAVTPTPDGGVAVVGDDYGTLFESLDWRVVGLDSQGKITWGELMDYERYEDRTYAATSFPNGDVEVYGTVTVVLSGPGEQEKFTQETVMTFRNPKGYGTGGASTPNGRRGSTQAQTSALQPSGFFAGLIVDGTKGFLAISEKNEDGTYTVTKARQGETWTKTLPANEPVLSLVATTDGGVVIATPSYIYKLGIPSAPPAIALSNLAARPNPVVAGQPISFSATVSNFTNSYSYTLTNGVGSTKQGSATTATFSQSLAAAGSGPQTYTLTVSNATSRASAIVSVTVTAAGTAKFSVFHYDGNDKKSPASNNRPQPRLRLHNEGTTAVPYRELTIRYWLTVETFKPLTYQEIYYAPVVGIPNVRMRYVALTTPRQGAGGYIEYSFTDQAGTSSPKTNSGPIHSAIGMEGWLRFNETNDYSYAGVTSFTKNNRITVYRNGVLVGGVEPAAGGRLGSDEEAALRVVVLGNPITEDQLEVDVLGAEGEALQLRLVDAQGRLMGQAEHPSASDQQRFRLDVGKGPTGVLLLHVSTPMQQQTVKLLKR